MSRKYKIQVVAAKADAPAEILVYGPIGKSFWSDEGISAEEFANAINEIPKGTKFTVGINSQGGAIGEGIAMFNALERRKEDATARIDGYALSAASFFPLAAGRVISPATAVWMIHCGWSVVQGNANQLRKDADMLDVHDQAMVNAYVSKTGKTRAKILEAMNAETWMTGSEAVAYGLADAESSNPVDLNALDFSEAKGGTFKSLADALNKWTQAGFKAAALAIFKCTTAPAQGAANNTPTKEPTMKREEIIALLKTWGVKVADDATDEWLKAELAKGKPAAPTTPAPAATPESALAKQLEEINKRLEKERRNAVKLQIDQLILDNKVTASERDAEIELCMANEDRIEKVLSKRPATLPGAAPLTPSISFGAEGPRDHVMKVPRANKQRFHFIRDNYEELLRAGYRKPGTPQAANTTDAQLVTDTLVEGATTILQNRLAPVRAFAKEVSADPIKPLAVLQHRKITAGGTGQTNATNFEDTTNFVGTEVNVPITMAQLTTGKHVTNAERQSGVMMAQWVEKHVAEMGDLVMAAIAAVITVGNFTATPLTSAAVAFGDNELKTLWGQLKKASIKNIILDGEYYARFLPGSNEDFTIEDFRFRGWDGFFQNTVWTGATANTVGFACHPQAIVVGIGTPLIEGNPNRQITNIVLPGIGITVQVNEWQSNITRAEWKTYDVMFGAAANDTTAGVLIKSA